MRLVWVYARFAKEVVGKAKSVARTAQEEVCDEDETNDNVNRICSTANHG